MELPQCRLGSLPQSLRQLRIGDSPKKNKEPIRKGIQSSSPSVVIEDWLPSAAWLLRSHPI